MPKMSSLPSQTCQLGLTSPHSPSPGIWTHHHGINNSSTVPLAQADIQMVTTQSHLTNSPASSPREEPVEPRRYCKTSSLSPGLATRHDKPLRTEMCHLRELEELAPMRKVLWFGPQTRTKAKARGRDREERQLDKAVCSSCCGNT